MGADDSGGPTLCCLRHSPTRLSDTGPFGYNLGGWEPPWGIEYRIDHLSGLMLVLIATIGLLAAISAKPGINMDIRGKETNFYTLLLLQITGLLGIVITGDLFNIFVFLEISSLSGYGLIAHGEDGAPMATFNYIIIGTIGASFYLLGVGYLYMATGSLNIADLATILPNLYHSKVILVGFAFFTTGVAIKMGLFPTPHLDAGRLHHSPKPGQRPDCSLNDQSCSLYHDSHHVYPFPT